MVDQRRYSLLADGHEVLIRRLLSVKPRLASALGYNRQLFVRYSLGGARNTARQHIAGRLDAFIHLGVTGGLSYECTLLFSRSSVLQWR